MRNVCTIIIINWNSWRLLEDCLEALCRQTFPHFQVVVADNSCDGPIPAAISSRFTGVTIIQNRHNYGFAAGNNRVLFDLVNTKWTVCLNPDTQPDPQWLEQLVESAEQNPEFTFFGSRLYFLDNHQFIDGDGDRYHISGMAWRDAHGWPRRRRPSLASREVFSPCAAAAMYRTDILKELGAFDEDYFCYFEDVDLGFRLQLAGHRCLQVPSAVVYHKGSATSGGPKNDFAVYHGHRNLIWTFFKNMPGVLLWLFLPLHLALNLATLVFFTLRGQGRIILKAKIDALKGLPKVLKKRKAAKRYKTGSTAKVLKLMDKRIYPIRRPIRD